MKSFSAFASLLALLLPLRAEIVLTGMISVDGEEKATFKDTGDGRESAWLGQGATFNGYAVKVIRTKESSAILVKDGNELVVRLQAASVQKMSEPASPQPPSGGPPDLSVLSDAELHSMGFHRTGKGETGARIAKAMGITLAELQRLNPDVNWARLKVGEIVRYRGPGSKPPPELAKDKTAPKP